MITVSRYQPRDENNIVSTLHTTGICCVQNVRTGQKHILKVNTNLHRRFCKGETPTIVTLWPFRGQQAPGWMLPQNNRNEIGKFELIC